MSQHTIIEPDGTWTVRRGTPTFEEARKIVGGFVTQWPASDMGPEGREALKGGMVVLVDEDATLKELPPNPVAQEHLGSRAMVYGTLLLVEDGRACLGD